MGVVMLGGILFSAILTFFVVPSAFYLFERKRVARVEEQNRVPREMAARGPGALRAGARGGRGELLSQVLASPGG